MVFNIYITDGDDRRGRAKSKSIINHIENHNTNITYRDRDFLVNGSELDQKRKAVNLADLVLIVFTDQFLESPEFMYDAALAICYERRVILIDCRRKKDIPPLLRSLPKISARKNFNKVLQKLASKIQEFRTQLSGTESSRRKDDALEYIRTLEREESLQHEISLHNRLKSVQAELKNANHEMKIARHMHMVEEDTISNDLELQLGVKFELQRQLQEITTKYRTLKRNFSLLQHETSLERSRRGYENTSSDESSTDNIETGKQNKGLEDQINRIYMLILKLNNKVNKDDTGRSETHIMPSELKSFCQKYTKMIGPNIRHFGRLLNLTTEELDKVEEYRKHGYEEMFWQIIKIWQPKARIQGTFVTLLNSLEEIGVDIGGKPMTKSQISYLHEKMPYLLKNVYRISDLIPHLLSSHTLTQTTQMYVTEAKTEEDKILRLINVLTTKSYGIKALCDALDATDQSFIVTELEHTMPCTSLHLSATEYSDYSSDSPYISDGPKLQVAVVAPSTKNSLSKQTRNTNDPIEHDQGDGLTSTPRGMASHDEMSRIIKDQFPETKLKDLTEKNLKHQDHSSKYTPKSTNKCIIQ